MSPPDEPTESNTPPRERLIYVPLDQLRPAPHAPSAQAVSDELVNSVKTYGILQPLMVRPGEGGYQVVAGFKRLAAARKAGLTDVPVRAFRVEDASLEALYEASNLTSDAAAGRPKTAKTRRPSPPPATGSPSTPGGLSGLLEEELNRKPNEAPYGFILGVAALVIGLLWGGTVLYSTFSNADRSPDDPDPAPTARQGSVLFPTPGPGGQSNSNNLNSGQVPRWKGVLGGIDGIQIRDQGGIPRIVFNDAVFSRMSQIDESQSGKLVELVEAIHASDPNVTLVIIGHTDNDPVRPNGTYRDNEHLGMLRSQAVTAFLAENSPLKAHQLRENSSGSENPPFSNDNPDDKVRNRTVSIEIISSQP